jgi:hypothetical protein
MKPLGRRIMPRHNGTSGAGYFSKDADDPMPPRSILKRPIWGYLAAAASSLAGLLFLAAALRNNVGFPLDDSWIHQVVARNLVQFHTWGFTPGVMSSGSSSTLWTLVLAFNYWLLPNISPVLFALVVNGALLLASSLLLWHMAIKDGLPPAEAFALGILPGFSGNWIWLAFTGMEHVLFVALSLLAIVLWFGSKDSPGNAVLTGIALGAVGLARPEGLVLALILFALYRRCGRSARDVLQAAIAAFVLLAPSFVLNLKTSGSLLPATSKGRRFLYTGSPKIHIGRSSVLSLLSETYHRILGHHFFNSESWWIAPLVGFACYGVVVLLRRFPNRTSVLCLWGIAQYACYCIVLPAAGHGGRYQPFVLLLFAPLLAVGLIDLARRVTPARSSGFGLQTALASAVLLLVLCLTLPTLVRWQRATRDSIYDINHCHRQLAYWMNAHLPPGTVVAVSDIGAIGYFAHIHLIDLGGLVDEHFLDYQLSGRVPEYLAARNAHYVVLSHDGTDTHVGDMFRLLHNPALCLVPLHTDGIDESIWAYGNAYTELGYHLQTLYRIEPVPPADRNPAETERNTAIAAAAAPDPANP